MAPKKSTNSLAPKSIKPATVKSTRVSSRPVTSKHFDVLPKAYISCRTSIDKVTELSITSADFKKNWVMIIRCLDNPKVSSKQLKRAASMAMFYAKYARKKFVKKDSTGKWVWSDSKWGYEQGLNDNTPSKLLNASHVFMHKIREIENAEMMNPALTSNQSRQSLVPKSHLPKALLKIQDASIQAPILGGAYQAAEGVNTFLKHREAYRRLVPGRIPRFKYCFDLPKNKRFDNQYQPEGDKTLRTFRHVMYHGELDTLREWTTEEDENMIPRMLPKTVQAALTGQQDPLWFDDCLFGKDPPQVHEVDGHSKLIFVNGFSRWACFDDVRELENLAESVLDLYIIFDTKNETFTQDEVKPFIYVLWHMCMYDWGFKPLFLELASNRLEGLRLGKTPSQIIYTLMCILENITAPKIDEGSRLTSKDNLDSSTARNILTAAKKRRHHVGISESSMDDYEDEDEDEEEFDEDDELYFREQIFHSLPHDCEKEQDMGSQAKVELFQITTKARQLLEDIETSCSEDQAREAERMIPTLKKVYMYNMSPMRDFYSFTDDTESKRGDDMTLSDQEFRERWSLPEYFELEVMPRWWCIPRLIPRLIAAANLDLVDLEEEIGLDLPINSAYEAALARIKQRDCGQAEDGELDQDLTMLDAIHQVTGDSHQNEYLGAQHEEDEDDGRGTDADTSMDLDPSTSTNAQLTSSAHLSEDEMVSGLDPHESILGGNDQWSTDINVSGMADLYPAATNSSDTSKKQISMGSSKEEVDNSEAASSLNMVSQPERSTNTEDLSYEDLIERERLLASRADATVKELAASNIKRKKNAERLKELSARLEDAQKAPQARGYTLQDDKVVETIDMERFRVTADAVETLTCKDLATWSDAVARAEVRFELRIKGMFLIVHSQNDLADDYFPLFDKHFAHTSDEDIYDPAGAADDLDAC